MTGEVMTGEEVRDLVVTNHRLPQQVRSRATVDRILVAADAEFGEVGMQAASTTSIAKRAGLSVGALYRFFKDKEEVADALTAEYVVEVWAQYRPLAEGSSGRSGLEGIARPVRAWIDQAALEQARHPGFFRLLAEVPEEGQPESVVKVRRQFDDLMVELLLARGVQASPEDLMSAVRLCTTTVRGALVRVGEDAEVRARLVEELSLMLPSYLAARFGT